jgi:hypothetical protein
MVEAHLETATAGAPATRIRAECAGPARGGDATGAASSAYPLSPSSEADAMTRTSLLIRIAAATLLPLLGVGCATTGLTDAQELDLYRAHAGEPVKKFTFFGQLSGWTPLGETALAVWTKPSQAYLLELPGRCVDLDTAPAITVTNQGSRVYAKFDDVLVLGGLPNSFRMPCRIDTIRPLDVKALRQAQKSLREARAAERAAAVPAPAER